MPFERRSAQEDARVQELQKLQDRLDTDISSFSKAVGKEEEEKERRGGHGGGGACSAALHDVSMILLTAVVSRALCLWQSLVRCPRVARRVLDLRGGFRIQFSSVRQPVFGGCWVSHTFHVFADLGS